MEDEKEEDGNTILVYAKYGFFVDVVMYEAEEFV